MRTSELDILFEPLEMRNLKVENRLFMAPMGQNFDFERLKAYYVARAKGGVGMITTGETSVHPLGRFSGKDSLAHELCLESENDIKTHEPLVKAVQEHGVKIISQINHVGRYAQKRLLGCQSVAPSAVASRFTGEVPSALSTDEADALVTAFVNAACRARQAGYDGVEILACSGYLISQFLSPVTNCRTDSYGGDTLSRARFLLSVIRETRKAVGDDFNISVKIDAEDNVPGGRVLSDTLMIAPELTAAGADRLHIWAGWHEAVRPMLPMFVPRGAFADYAAAIKAVVDVPVATVGRINDPLVAATILKEEKADLIGLARALLCDPDFVNKIRDGRQRSIRKCMACCHCFDELMTGKMPNAGPVEVTCSFNPELGKEGLNLFGTVKTPKNVLVVGGGPAGAECARVCALRGHRVTLVEKHDRIGGAVHLAYRPPHKMELENVFEYYRAQLTSLPVTLRLGETLTVETLEALAFDVVIVATGAIPLVPPISGVDKTCVVTALDILDGKATAGNCVVVIGGGLIGVETAEFLTELGKKVTVVEMRDKIAQDMGPTTRWGVMARIKKKMDLITSTRVTSITDDGVVVADQGNQKHFIAADTIVLAVGLKGDTNFSKLLTCSGVSHHVIGSCRSPGMVKNAVHEGFDLGCRI